MNILVTGATGFIGSHLVKALLQEGHYCRCLVRVTSKVDELESLGVELFYGDLTKPDSLQNITKEIDIVYHLAAMGHVSAVSKVAYQRSYDINVNGTKNLAEECCNDKVNKFIHFSSTAAMGLIKKPLVDETVPCQPSTPYQRSKYESEKIVEKYWKERGLPVVIIRPCMIYGVGGTGEFLKICKLIKKGLFPKIGRGKNLTPIVHVEDVVRAAMLSMDKGKPGETYLISSSKSFELDEMRRLIAKYLEVNKPYPYVPYSVAIMGAYFFETIAKLFKFTPVVTSKNIESTVTDRVFSIAKAKNELEYDPEVELEGGIKEVIRWYKYNRYL